MIVKDFHLWKPGWKAGKWAKILQGFDNFNIPTKLYTISPDDSVNHLPGLGQILYPPFRWATKLW